MDLVIGFLGGAALFCVAAIGLRLFLPFEWVSNRSIDVYAIWAGGVYHLVTATCEEAAWRGYAFENLASLLGCWWAQMIVAFTWFAVGPGRLRSPARLRVRFCSVPFFCAGTVCRRLLAFIVPGTGRVI
jgi:hypothetical protein